MATQVTKALQTLFDGDANAGVPNFGWRSLPLIPFDRTHVSDANEGLFRGFIRTFEFTQSADMQLHTRFLCPADRKINTPIYFKWHYSTNDVSSGNVRLQNQFTTGDVGDPMTAANSQAFTEAIDTQYEHYVTVFGPLGTTLEIGASVLLRFTRFGTDAADTYPDNIYHLGFEAYYQTDRIAVPNYLPPYFS